MQLKHILQQTHYILNFLQNLSFHNQNLSQPKQTTVHPITINRQTDKHTFILNFSLKKVLYCSEFSPGTGWLEDDPIFYQYFE